PISRPSVTSCSIAAGRWRSAATSNGCLPFSLTIRASFAHAVVLPEPWTPATITTAGLALGSVNAACVPPMVAVSSSRTTLTTCWAGVRLRITSSERARVRTRSSRSSATSTATSASSRAVRMSARAASTCLGWSLPRDRSFLKTAFRRPVNVSNIAVGARRTRVGRAGAGGRIVPTEHHEGSVNGRRASDLLQAKRLEVGLIGLRWFVAGFGVLQTVLTLRTGPADRPGYVVPVGFVLVTALATGNVLISVLTERATRAEQLRPVGLAAFLLDVAIITGLVWTYATPGNSMWVLGYLIPLEGAVRYQLAGALLPVCLAIALEPFRELYVTHRFPTHAYQGAAVAFRTGVELAVATV